MMDKRLIVRLFTFGILVLGLQMGMQGKNGG